MGSVLLLANMDYVFYAALDQCGTCGQCFVLWLVSVNQVFVFCARDHYSR